MWLPLLDLDVLALRHLLLGLHHRYVDEEYAVSHLWRDALAFGIVGKGQSLLELAVGELAADVLLGAPSLGWVTSGQPPISGLRSVGWPVSDRLS